MPPIPAGGAAAASMSPEDTRKPQQQALLTGLFLEHSQRKGEPRKWGMNQGTFGRGGPTGEGKT